MCGGSLVSAQRLGTGLPRSGSLLFGQRLQDLRPLPVAAGHVHGGDVLEELLWGDEVRQAGEELGHVDEVHAGEDVLVEAQQTQRRPEQELLAVPAEHVPNPTRQVQRQRLTVQGEDPVD